MKKKILITLFVQTVIFAIISVSFVSYGAPEDNIIQENESNDSFTLADIINSDDTVDGYLTCEDIDMFQFAVTDTSNVMAAIVSESEGITLSIFNEWGVKVFDGEFLTQDGLYGARIVTTLAPGTYYFVADDENDSAGLYMLYYLCKSETVTGQCGENATYTYNGITKELVISGSGAMYDYEFEGSPFFKSKVRSIIIEDGITSIGNCSFEGCSELAEIKISNSVKSIGRQAFMCCENLTDIDIPESVTGIGVEVFYACYSLEKITVNSGNKYYSSDIYGVLFNKDKTKLLQYPIGNKRVSYNIPNTVKTITNSSFADGIYLKNVTIPNTVISIDDYAFISCTNLTKISIPDSVTTIGGNAFAWTNLSEVTIGKGLVKAGSYAFISLAEKMTFYYAGNRNQFESIDFSIVYGMYEPFYNVEIYYNHPTHIYTAKITKNATCTSSGIKTNTCLCGDSYQETVMPYGHNSVTDRAVAATYKNTGLTEGSHCSVCKKVFVKQNVVKRLTLSKVSGLKASSIGTTSLKFTWNKVTGAEKYEVYYSTNGKSWKKVTTSKNSVTVKKLKTGTTYKVKVRAVAGGNTGSYSSVLTTSTKPSKVTLSKLTSGKKKLTAQWKTISGATGYEVTYSTSKKFTKKTTKTVTVKKAKTKKTTLKKLKSGKKYYVKVRAYKTVNGKKIYGSYSSVKMVKVK